MPRKTTEGRKEYQARRHSRRYEAYRSLLAAYKNVPCTDCGQRYPPYVMDFDHVRGEKAFNIGLGASKSLEDVVAEIAKCEVVCANCHRERTYGP